VKRAVCWISASSIFKVFRTGGAPGAPGDIAGWVCCWGGDSGPGLAGNRGRRAGTVTNGAVCGSSSGRR
jgi:hypothetical protein